ncbi:ankyrin repeat-containing protein [Colletotrichum scovillei]|uniref:ankyrin repeat-containing protein n=1 Tax=Colletotrichum scovillei TaxID=1209932 RepID=UPI0015C35650|nr:ankyrin repeat-containing protein [Colletotrichum scovillei]KAF4785288.1 ankyrin repeat-containing protein [Colletotrichum scovillei]
MLLSPSWLCEGTPTFQEEYRGSYVPNFIEAWHGPQIVAPDTPYVAAAGKNSLYFIDTRFEASVAEHIKAQIEWATVMVGPEEVIAIDEIEATAEVRNSAMGETVFVFDPAYARVLFARGINRRNPEIKLPELDFAGDWLVTYQSGLTKMEDV